VGRLPVTIRVNGTEVGSAEFGSQSARQVERFAVPAAAIGSRPGDIEIEIAVAELRSPSAYGLNDPRRLGLLVRRVVLRPA
jgi:hypothetical protein